MKNSFFGGIIFRRELGVFFFDNPDNLASKKKKKKKKKPCLDTLIIQDILIFFKKARCDAVFFYLILQFPYGKLYVESRICQRGTF